MAKKLKNVTDSNYKLISNLEFGIELLTEELKKEYNLDYDKLKTELETNLKKFKKD